MLYLFLVILLISTIFHIVTRYGRRGRMMGKIPGPTALPILGNAFTFHVDCGSKFWDVARYYTAKYYPITRFWICSSAVASLRHPYDLEILLSSQKAIEKGHIYEYLHSWLKNGLLTSTGDRWRQRRRILTPAFHFNILKKYVDIINEEGRTAVADLKTDGKESIQNLMNFCSKCTLNIICESTMGVRLRNMDKRTLTDYRKSVHDMGNIVLFRIPKPYIYSWMMPYIYKWGKMQSTAIEILHSFSKRLIEERIMYHKSNNNKFLMEDQECTDNVYEDNIGKKKRLAMLDLLLAAKEKNQIDFDGIQEEVDTFTFEGHDTTGMALVYTLLLLAEHKEEQKKCRIEVTELLDRTDGNLQISDLQELTFLERCIKESLRLYPPVATLERYVTDDIQLKHALIPGGTHIIIHLYDTHRDPNFWTEPEKFNPDRFLPENSKDRHPFCFLPFSAGPRNCIGQKFAMMEMKLLIAQLLYDFHLEPVDRLADMKLIADIVIRPLKPVRIKFVSIKKEEK